MPLSVPPGKGQGSTSIRPRSISSSKSSLKIGKIIRNISLCRPRKVVTIKQWKIAIQNINNSLDKNFEVYILKHKSAPKNVLPKLHSNIDYT